MKRIIAFLLSLMLALSLCACQIFEENVPTTDSTTSTVVTDPIETDPTTSTVVTDPTETTPSTETTVPSTDATESTDPAWHLQEVADKLAEYATNFNWNDGVTEVILTAGLPDMDMFDRVEQLDELTYDIYLSDSTVYRMVLDAGSGDVQAIQDIATNTNYYGN